MAMQIMKTSSEPFCLHCSWMLLSTARQRKSSNQGWKNWPATHPLRAVSNWVLQTPRFRGDSLVPFHRFNYHFRFIARSSKWAYIKPHIMMLPFFFRTLHSIRETKILRAGLDG